MDDIKVILKLHPELPMHNGKTIQRLIVLKALIEELGKTTSNTGKRELLITALQGKRWQFIERCLRIVADPFRNHYLRSESVGNPDGSTLHSGTDFLEALDLFAARQISGREQRAMWKCCKAELPEEFGPILDKLLDRDLGVRCGISEINNAFDALGLPLVREFSVALGTPYEKDKKGNLPELFDGGHKWAMSRKYDGLRCLFILNGDEVRLLTRSGNEFQTLGVLKDHAKFWPRPGFTGAKIPQPSDSVARMIASAKLPEGFHVGAPVVLDGEVALATKDGSDDFKGIMKEWGRKDHTIKNPRFHVFDCIPYDEFISGEGQTPFKQRQQMLRVTLDALDPQGQHFTQVEQEPCVSLEDLEHGMQRAAVAGWEGLILRARAVYKGRRSKDIWKVKTFFTDEFRVRSIIEGEMLVTRHGFGNVVEKVMSAVTFKYKNGTVSCGSGFSLDERRLYLKKPDQIVGHVIAVRHFGETTDDKTGLPSLRFPTFVGHHGQERTT